MSRHIFIQPVSCAISLALAACAIPDPFVDPATDGQSTGPVDGGQSIGPVDPDASPCLQDRAQIQGLFREQCAGCHDDGNTKGGLGSVTDLDSLIGLGLVVRGESTNSLLYQRLESGAMPQGGSRLSDEQLAGVARWIDVCTVSDSDSEDISLTEAPACKDNRTIVFDEVLAAIRRDIIELDPVRARTTRYFTFTHLHNSGYCDAQLEGYRHALAKLVNHLSFGPYIITPEAIDDERTIYRIDLVDYDWTPEIWRVIVEQNPYALVFEDDAAETVRELTNTEVFSIVGDWFIEAASQPPLYHDILGIPGTLEELERDKLGLPDVAGAIEREIQLDADLVLRAGLQTSGVSNNNRVIERHQLPASPDRAYWLSYDFGSNSAPQKDIFDFPLDFQADGGEVIFTLPNGLQGYMIVDGAGERIDEAPTAVVRDHENPLSETVVNGVSCMGCHSEGMRLATDDVVPFVVGNPKFGVDLQERVERLYAPADVFAAAQQRDVATFADAMALTGAPRLVGGKEPVIAVHIAFDQDLDLRRIAAELGFSVDVLTPFLGSLVGLDKLPLLKVDRQTFQDNFCRNAAELQLVPYRLLTTGACDPIPQ